MDFPDHTLSCKSANISVCRPSMNWHKLLTVLSRTQVLSLKHHILYHPATSPAHPFSTEVDSAVSLPALLAQRRKNSPSSRSTFHTERKGQTKAPPMGFVLWEITGT